MKKKFFTNIFNFSNTYIHYFLNQTLKRKKNSIKIEVKKRN